MDDWLDGAADRSIEDDHDKLMREREYELLKSEYKKTGYIDTVSASREEYLQEGFDIGFFSGGSITFRLYQIYGFSSALLRNRAESESRNEATEKLELLVNDMKDFLANSRAMLVRYPAPIQEFNQRCEQYFTRLAELCSSLGVKVSPLREFSQPLPRASRDSDNDGDLPPSNLEW
eukprot:TRINITY_DN11081_c0_g1_i1.p1 TRINITY_DN11081_c0_g1~~TRINITY_DN11081_c0_g1_i1.p1  ORF type:complete len:176 (-),score=22.82 TRINITY_DN11081_c0_g1_i1:204-731(-)